VNLGKSAGAPALFSCAVGSAKGQRRAYNQSGIRAFKALVVLVGARRGTKE
jgi:hypothetical protein